MKHFLIYTNKNKDADLAITNRIKEYLEHSGQQVTVWVKEADWKSRTPEEEMRDKIAELERRNHDLQMENDLLKKVRELEMKDRYL